jgi:triosephosphate isomerase
MEFFCTMPRTHKAFVVIANWKMNKTVAEAKQFAEGLKGRVSGIASGIWIAVPFTAIQPVRNMLPQKIVIGAQNMNDATAGAFTGEIAAAMIKEAGAEFVILGHSERRLYFHESDEFINRKVLRAIESLIKPVLCIGEGFDDREDGKTDEVLRRQLTAGLMGVSKESLSICLIAYEPVWAIGTGKAATPEIVLETHASIRSILASLYDEQAAEKVLIVYGGSVSATTAEALASVAGVDGFLIGTASLNPEGFAKIASLSDNACEQDPPI